MFTYFLTPHEDDNDGRADDKDGCNGLQHPPKENGMYNLNVYVYTVQLMSKFTKNTSNASCLEKI